MYHRIASLDADPLMLAVQPRHFVEHLEILRTTCYPMRFDALLGSLSARSVPARSIAVTFDDGYIDNLTTARPALDRADVPATVFVTAGQIDSGREFWWDQLQRILLSPGTVPGHLALEIQDRRCSWDLGDSAIYSTDVYEACRDWTVEDSTFPTVRHQVFVELIGMLRPLPDTVRRQVLASLSAWAGAADECRGSYRAVSAPEVAALASGGLIEVGAHTMTHPVLASLDTGAQWTEVNSSKTSLEAIVGSRVESFAYPYGEPWAYTADTVIHVRNAGFKRACCTAATTTWRRTDPFEIPRYVVRDWDGDEFARRLESWHRE